MKPGKRSFCLLLLAVLALNALVFLPARHGAFVWDDRDLIADNPFLRSPGFAWQCWLAPFQGPPGDDRQRVEWTRAPLFYRPLTLFSYWLDWKIWGMNPAAFHLTNLGLHLLAIALAAALVVAAGGGGWLALACALLFSLFPLHGESVAWISGRTDLLAFVLLALSALLFVGRRQGQALPALAGFLFFLSLLAKESGLPLALLPGLYVLLRGNGPARALRASLPFLAAAAAWAALRFVALGPPAGEWAAYPWFAPLAALGFYGQKLLLPWKLNLTIDPLPVLTSAGYALAGGALLAAAGAAVVVLRRRPGRLPWLVLLAGFALAILPSLFIPFSASIASPMAWRFLYLPSFFFLTALALAFQRRARLHAAVKAAACTLAAMLFLAELLPLPRLFGQSEEGFWMGIERVAEQSPLAQINVAAVQLQRGDEEALATSRRLLQRRNDPRQRHWEAAIYENLASYHAGRGEFEQAALYFRKLEAYARDLPLSARLKSAFFLVLTGKRREGLARFEALLGAYPRQHDVLRHAAEALIILGDLRRARDLLNRDYALFRLPETRQRLDQLPAEAP